ncbi:MAG: hypothetical protein LBT71_03495 [Azoarcus sp.]|jgi:hypothetical protein|nr:hypothetical protein [Azoarcus sp.]
MGDNSDLDPASRAAPEWEKLLDLFKPQAMLLRREMAIRQVALASGCWKQVFEDERYAILIQNTAR